LLFTGYALGFGLLCCGRRRRTAFKNIKTAFPEKTKSEICAIMRKNFLLFGRSLIESLVVPRIYKYIRLTGDQTFTVDGGICVGIHAGSWEAVNCYFAHRFKYAILAQPQKSHRLNKILDELRMGEGLRVCFSLKELIRSIKESYLIGMVVDHGLEAGALVVDFFSQSVPTPGGAVYLARKFNKKIYPCFSYRGSRFSMTIEVGMPIEVNGRTDQAVLRQLNALYEDYLRHNPWEYHWCYKRFKYKRNRDVLIVSDGRTGHTKQSRALSCLLQEGPYSIRAVVVEVGYKYSWMRLIADIAACLAFKHDMHSWWWLSFVLDKTSRDALARVSADIVIGTGSFIAPTAVLMASYLGARSASVLRPNFPLRKFDLTIIPEHDRVVAENTAVIKGALFYPCDTEDKARQCRSFFRFSDDKKKTVLFIGGPLSEEQGFLDKLKDFIARLRDFLNEHDRDLLVSTSRRTPASVEAYLEKELRSDSRLQALVIASRRNYDFVFEGFVALAEEVFVTSESISMITEIASLKKPCVCVVLEPIDQKRQLFFDSMTGELTMLTSPYEMAGLSPKVSGVFENNTTVVRKRIGVLL